MILYTYIISYFLFYDITFYPYACKIIQADMGADVDRDPVCHRHGAVCNAGSHREIYTEKIKRKGDLSGSFIHTDFCRLSHKSADH